MKRDGPYWFDENAAGRAVEFYPRFLRHVKGPLAGKRMELSDWQRDKFIAPLFGWKRPHTCASRKEHDPLKCEYGLRRYREAFLFVPRKNGKSTLVAGIELICLCADDEIGGEVYSAAWDQPQAGIVFDIAATMVEKSPTLRQRLKIRRSKYRIVDPVSDSFLWAIPADAAGAQGFNANCVGFDEYETQQTTELDRALDTSQGARRQPLFVRAATGGQTIDSPCGRLYLRAKQIEAGTMPARDDELIVIYEAPVKADPKETKTWVIANPGYGTSIQPSFVDKMRVKAIEEPSERADLYRYFLNWWADASDIWMQLERWDACGAFIDVDALKGRRCFVGIGLFSASDIASVAVLFPPTEEDPYVLLMAHFIPEDIIRDRAKQQGGPPYQDWIDKGAINVTDGNEVDYERIENYVLDKIADRYDVAQIAGNRRNAAQLLQDFGAADEDVVELTSGFAHMSPSLTELDRLVRGEEIAHQGDVVLRWSWNHAVVKKSPNAELRLDREKSRGNLEPIVALAFALNCAIREGAEQEGKHAAS